MFLAVEDDVLVRFIRKHQDVVFLGDGGDIPEAVPVENRACRVGRGIDDHEFGLGAHRLLDVLGIDLEAVFLIDRDRDRNTPEQPDLGVIIIARVDDDDFVVRFEQMQAGVENPLHGPDADKDFRLGIRVDAVFCFQLFSDGLAQVGEALGRGIPGVPLVHGGFRRFPNEGRGVEIRLADAQVDDIGNFIGQGKHNANPGPFHCMGPGGKGFFNQRHGNTLVICV